MLAVLAMHVGEVVPSERLITYLWGETPPRTAATALQNSISQLRKVLGSDVVETRTPGYVLTSEKEAVDARRFEGLLDEARSAEAERRIQLVHEALQLWRGAPLGDFAYESFAQGEAARLEELRLAAIEERIAAELELGAAAGLVGELEAHRARASAQGGTTRTAHARALPLRPAGRGSPGLPGCSAYARRRARDRADAGAPTAARLDPAPGVDPSAAGGARRRRGPDRRGCPRVALRAPRLRPRPGSSSTNGGSLASRLAEAFDCPEEHRGDLTRVSQYVAVTQGVGPLYDQLHELFVEGDEPGPVEHFLASLPELARARGSEHQLLVSTAYGHALERAFEERGEEADVVSFVALGPNRGKFLHRAPDGSETVVAVPNAYAELSLAERPVILKVHGGVDPASRSRPRKLRRQRRRLHRLSGPERPRQRRSGHPRGEAPPQPPALHLVPGRGVEPARLPAPGVRQRADQLPVVGGVARRTPGPARVLASAWGRPLRRSARGLRRRHRAAACRGGAGVIPDSPYKGLVPFEDSELDALLFFGRERESGDHRRECPRCSAHRSLRAERRREDVGPPRRRRAPPAHTGAAQRRGTRTSRVRGRRLRRLERGSGRKPPVSRARRARQLSSARRSSTSATGESLAETFGRWTDALACDLLLILDQAEEYFLYHQGEGGFTAELPELVTPPGSSRSRASLPARRRAVEARPLQGPDSEPLRELPAARPPRSSRRPRCG